MLYWDFPSTPDLQGHRKQSSCDWLGFEQLFSIMLKSFPRSILTFPSRDNRIFAKVPQPSGSMSWSFAAHLSSHLTFVCKSWESLSCHRHLGQPALSHAGLGRFRGNRWAFPPNESPRLPHIPSTSTHRRLAWCCSASHSPVFLQKHLGTIW